MLADKDYDSDTFVEQIKGQDSIAVIPPRAKKELRQYDEELYKDKAFGRNILQKTQKLQKNFLKIR